MQIGEESYLIQNYEKIKLLFDDLSSFGINLYKTVYTPEQDDPKNKVILVLLNQAVAHFDAINRLILSKNKSIVLSTSLQVRSLLEIEINLKLVTLIPADINFSFIVLRDSAIERIKLIKNQLKTSEKYKNDMKLNVTKLENELKRFKNKKNEISKKINWDKITEYLQKPKKVYINTEKAMSISDKCKLIDYYYEQSGLQGTTRDEYLLDYKYLCDLAHSDINTILFETEKHEPSRIIKNVNGDPSLAYILLKKAFLTYKSILNIMIKEFDIATLQILNSMSSEFSNYFPK